MRILAIIPARGGSKGVSRKNIRLLGGKPLIAWTIEAARGARSLDRVVVSTDDDEIASISRRYGAEIPFMRPAELAADDTPTLPVLRHAVERLKAEEGCYAPDAVMTLQPTSPLRTADHIDDAAALFRSDPSADSLVSCIRVPHIYHPRSVMRHGENGYLVSYLRDEMLTRRQEKDPVYARNGPAICITRTERLGEFVFGGRLIGYEMDEISSVDIDDLDDFARAERMLSERARMESLSDESYGRAY